MTDEELVISFVVFCESEQWVPGMSKLTDLSKGDGSQITTDDGLERLAITTEKIFRKNEVEFSKATVYAPKDLTFGLSRIYEVMISESTKHVKVFRDLDAAKEWLANKRL